LVVNGGFESGRSPWSESAAGGYEIISTELPHTGSYSAWLCGYNNCNDQIWQTVTLPANFSSVTLSYYLYMDTQETTGSVCYDHFYARIRSSSGATITTPTSLCNYNRTNSWVFKSANLTSALSAYKGQKVEVYFQGTTDSSLVTDDFVDDVTLNVS
jgi:kumamolisin